MSWVTLVNGRYISPATGRRYQVRTLDGNPVEASYRGPGQVVSGDRLIIGGPNTVRVDEYRVDTDPVPGTEEYEAGYIKGVLAQRKRYGTDWSQRFISGYQAAWEGRAAGQLDLCAGVAVRDELRALHEIPEWTKAQSRREAHLSAMHRMIFA